MTFMSSISMYDTVQHEPFNVDRTWGAIVSDFTNSKNEETLKTAVSNVLASKPNIKHCFEIIPLEVTRALIEVCDELGYTFFVLTRRNEVDRLMSLMLARTTGAWGGEKAKVLYPKIISGEIAVPPLPVDDAVRQARRDASFLGDVLKLLRHRKITYDWLVFEEIYKETLSIQDHALKIARLLGVDMDRSDVRLLRLEKGSAQNSGQIEARVENAEAVRRRLAKICLS